MDCAGCDRKTNVLYVFMGVTLCEECYHKARQEYLKMAVKKNDLKLIMGL